MLTRNFLTFLEKKLKKYWDRRSLQLQYPRRSSRVLSAIQAADVRWRGGQSDCRHRSVHSRQVCCCCDCCYCCYCFCCSFAKKTYFRKPTKGVWYIWEERYEDMWAVTYSSLIWSTNIDLPKQIKKFLKIIRLNHTWSFKILKEMWRICWRLTILQAILLLLQLPTQKAKLRMMRFFVFISRF